MRKQARYTRKVTTVVPGYFGVTPRRLARSDLAGQIKKLKDEILPRAKMRPSMQQ